MAIVNIRQCNAADLHAMYDLVVELAVFEKEPDSVVASRDEYMEEYQHKTFDGLVATVDDAVVGMALYYPIFSTWMGKCIYLEDFVVKQEYRSEGIGQMLWDNFVDTVRAMGCRQIRWQVLDWNTAAIKFYERNGAAISKEWYNGRMLLDHTSNDTLL